MKDVFRVLGAWAIGLAAFAAMAGAAESPQGGSLLDVPSLVPSSDSSPASSTAPLPPPQKPKEALVPQVARGIGAAQRTVSLSGQFVVYCPDVRMRLAVAGFAEAVKRDVLEIFKAGDHWKMPVVIDIRQPATTDPGRSLSRVQLVETDGGWRTEIGVTLRDGQLRAVRFPQLVVRAVLLELAYRDQPPQPGTKYIEPPSWLVEGLAQINQRKATETAPNAMLFRQMIETGKLPGIADFLRSNVATMDDTSLAIHGMCAASLVSLLAGMHGGEASLYKMVRSLPDSDGDPVSLLLKNFPALGGSEASLEKWWTLGLARTSIADGATALSVADTDARLAALLTLTLTDEKKKTTTDFALSDYKIYLKNPKAKLALSARCAGLSALMGQSHPSMWIVEKEYAEIASKLMNGKTRGIDKELQQAAEHRALIVKHMDQVADYLNWYEATQMPEQSGAFADFLQSAKTLESQPPPKRDDAISRYIDQLEREFD